MYVLEQIRARAAAEPRRLAMVFNGSPLSYGGLWRFVAGVRRSLEPHAAGRGYALLWVDSLVECWILDLAFRSLGYDTAQVLDGGQLALFEGLDAACIVTLASEPGKIVPDWPGVRHLVLGDPTGQAYSVSDPLPAPISDGRPAGGHVALTSGTTGRFKIVASGFGSEARSITRRQAFHARLGEAVDQPGPTTVLNIFNSGLWNGAGYLWPIFLWSLGGAVVIEQSDDVSRAFAWPGINRTMATPHHLMRLMALPQGAFPFLPEMQLEVIAGALSPHLYRETVRRLTPKVMINLSATETRPWAMTPVASEEDLRWYRLYPEAEVEVANDAGEPLPAGELGRVRVALTEDDATAYVGDPAASAKVFKDGWFYPGDMGVLDRAGRLALFGRDSDIVHLNGDKYPAEPWERAIRDKLSCDAVCVLSGNWRTGAEQLHVFVESRRPISQAALAEAVRTGVAGFAQVQAYVVESLPRTATGKVRRGALAEMLYKNELPGDAA
jgi:acyl-CoA synthetase (AMP-forming)/AMP-acid ligase II